MVVLGILACGHAGMEDQYNKIDVIVSMYSVVLG